MACNAQSKGLRREEGTEEGWRTQRGRAADNWGTGTYQHGWNIGEGLDLKGIRSGTASG